MKLKLSHIGIWALLMGLFTACHVGNVSKSGGKDNQSYLQFVQGGEASYKSGVTVYIDQNPEFTAKVDKPKKFDGTKGNVYVINSGKRHLKVVYDGNTLYEKDIIVGTQETKKITLP